MNTLAEDDWKLLLKNIANGNCTPFLGAGAGYGSLPLAGDIAHDWGACDRDPDCRPRPATRLVFHLHGPAQPQALVLTEDDYLRFLVTMAGEGKQLLPKAVREALDRNALLFIGYRLADWNFRALLQLLR